MTRILILSTLCIIQTVSLGQMTVEQAMATLRDVDRAFLQATRRNDIDAVRAGARLLESLHTLDHAPAKARDEVCDWLRRRIIDSKGAVEFRYRWRVIAIGLIARLSESEKWVKYLERIAHRSKDSPRFGLDLYVGRALGQIRSPAQVHYLMKRVRSNVPEVATLALRGLAGLERQDLLSMLGPLTPRLVALSSDRNGRVAAAAVEVLSRMGTPDAVAAIVQAAKAEPPSTRRAVARALAPRISTPGAETVLGRLLQDVEPRVREDAARALSRCRTRGPVPLLVGRLDKEPLRNRAVIADSLRHLTGVSLPPEPQPWSGWLKSSKATGRADPDKASGADPVAATKKYAAPKYHGFPVESDRVVFALDVSESMRYQIGAGVGVPSRLQAARQELEGVIGRLDVRTRFGLVVFGPSAIPYESALEAASFRIKKDAINWLSRQTARGGTNTYGALRLAFTAFPKMDTLFLLSDGTPTVGATTVHERILRDVVTWNERRSVRIHTIALLRGADPVGDEGRAAKADALRFLQDLAEATAGDFLVLQ